MKTILLILERLFSKRISALLMLIFFALTVHSQIIVSGHQRVCEHETEIYTLQGAIPGVIYSWTITPSIGTISLIGNNQGVIQWNTEDTCAIIVTGGGDTTAAFMVIVYKTNKPSITFNNQVGCQKISTEDTVSYNEIIEDPNSCINVCEYSEVEYISQATLLYGQNLSQFTWAVTGGEIIGVDGVTVYPPANTVVSGSLFVPNGTYSRIAVKWDSIGTGTITVSELTPYVYPTIANPTNCGPKTTTMCLDIIEKPQANFLVDNQHFPSTDDCYQICLDQTVSFYDISTIGSGTEILFWQWNFGDGSPISHQQSPSHKYTSPGNYDVSLTVTNRCNCTSEFSILICVDELPPPNIVCPGVICENNVAKYTIDVHCPNYNWTITGGAILSQNDPEIEVMWDNVDSTGFGYLTFDGKDCEEVCPAITTVRIPVIAKEGSIKGPTKVCADQIYIFELPAWPATNFEWSLPSNTNGTTFNTLTIRDNFAEVLTGSTGGSFDLKCTYYSTITKSACFGSAIITVDVQPKPKIEIAKRSCINLSVQCTLMDGTTLYSGGATEWSILKPDGTEVQYVSSVNPDTIPSSFFNISGKYRIFAKSVNGLYCEPEFEAIDIVNIPSKPIMVYGDDHICAHYPYNYTTDIVNNTLMHWNVIGANPPLLSTTNSKNITWNTLNTKSITLYREWEDLSGCVSDTFTKIIHNNTISGTIIGNDSTFEDVVDSYVMSLDAGVIGEVFQWEVTPAGVGNIKSGQGTSYCEIIWLHQAAPTTATIKCFVTKCGVSHTFTKLVFIDKSAEIVSVIPNPSPACSGDSVVFTIVTTGAPVSSYIWDFGDGTTQVVTPAVSTTTDTISHIYSNIGNAGIIFPVKASVVSSNTGFVSSSMITNITVNPEPNSYLSPGNPTSVPPDTLPMALLVSTTNSSANSYQWYYIEEGTSTTVNRNSTINTDTIKSATPFKGEYWCVVTNSYGCTKKTNSKIINDGGSSISGCTPLAPAGISGFPTYVTSLSPCGQAQISCFTLGDTNSNGNILGWNWGVSPSSTQYTTSGSSTINQSPVFTFAKAGMYKIMLHVNYLNNIPAGPPCSKSEGGYVIVPMVVDFHWGFACTSPNYNSYELLLYDYSSLYPGYTLATRKWEIMDTNLTVLTTIYANNSQDTIYTVPSSMFGMPLIVKLTISNSPQTGSFCSKTQTINIPSLPIADFAVTTTYAGNPSSPYKSCENREILFTNNSSDMDDIHSNIWEFGTGIPPEISHMVNTFGVYNILNSSQFLYFNPKLTVTDKYGCKDDTSVQIMVYDNTLKRKPFSTEYSPAIAESCPGQNLNDTITPIFIGGSGNLNYQWYNKTKELPNVVTPTLTYAYDGTGAYWVRITDMHNCYLNLNPTPALISQREVPLANIIGIPDVCENGDNVVLKVMTGMDSSILGYNWTMNGSSFPNNNTKTVVRSPNVLNNPTSDFVVTVSDQSLGGCSAVSSPYTINLHQPPTNISITPPSIIDCDQYELSLTASANSPSGSPLNYNWSTGFNGATTTIYNGGVYRVWVKDQFGCEKSKDRAVQYPSDYYFWRFPTGCYSFCPDELPKRIWPSTWVYGVGNILFSSWAWIHDGGYVSDITNGPQAYTLCNYGSSFPSGNTNSIPCRLYLDEISSQPFKGEGSGDYSWLLDNGLCRQESDILSLNIEDCCRLELVIEEIRCIRSSPTGNEYQFTLVVDGVPCPTRYNLSGINNYIPFPSPNAITINSISTQNLNPGHNILTGTFISQPNDSVVQFFVNILCEKCYGESNIEILPPCSGMRLANIDGMLSDSTLTNEVKLNVFPNPANDFITISFSYVDDKFNYNPNRMIYIMDLTGHILKTVDIQQTIGDIQMDMSEFAPGVYFVALMENNARIRVKRIVINH